MTTKQIPTLTPGASVQLNFGDAWVCDCGKASILNDPYLAAHWNESLVHTCDCGVKRTVKSGQLRDKRKAAKS